jgi:hypothetical protein
MAFTGQLGTADSMLGNIVLGFVEGGTEEIVDASSTASIICSTSGVATLALDASSTASLLCSGLSDLTTVHLNASSTAAIVCQTDGVFTIISEASSTASILCNSSYSQSLDASSTASIICGTIGVATITLSASSTASIVCTTGSAYFALKNRVYAHIDFEPVAWGEFAAGPVTV